MKNYHINSYIGPLGERCDTLEELEAARREYDRTFNRSIDTDRHLITVPIDTDKYVSNVPIDTDRHLINVPIDTNRRYG